MSVKRGEIQREERDKGALVTWTSGDGLDSIRAAIGKSVIVETHGDVDCGWLAGMSLEDAREYFASVLADIDARMEKQGRGKRVSGLVKDSLWRAATYSRMAVIVPDGDPAKEHYVRRAEDEKRMAQDLLSRDGCMEEGANGEQG